MTVYITGVSRGLGLALAEEYLKNGHQVVGIGRKTSLKHKKFIFINCDLSKHSDVEALQLEIPKNEAILLINNAGILGDVKRISEQDKDQSSEIFQVNTIAPIQLIRKFSFWCKEACSTLTILNISSGAGRKPIPSWANYCASKAALDLFSETFKLEEIEKGSTTKIFSLAPGVIDTDMQSHIRKSSVDEFSSLERFTKLHEEKELKSAKKIAQQIRQVLERNLLKLTISSLK